MRNHFDVSELPRHAVKRIGREAPRKIRRNDRRQAIARKREFIGG